MSIFDRLFKRDDFVGSSDRYLKQATGGFGAYDVTGSYFDKRMRDEAVNRVTRYKENWNAYRGFNSSGSRFTVNWIKPIVNKSVDWLFNNGWFLKVAAGNQTIADLIEEVWQKNDKDLLGWRLGQMGAVSGDVFMQVTAINTDGKGNKLPKEEVKIVLKLIDSSFVFPIHDSADDSKIAAIMIQYPIYDNRDAVSSNMVTQTRLYTQIVTPEKITEYIDDELKTTIDNPFEEINVVHIQNLPVSFGIYGMSDVEDLIEPVTSANGIYADMKEIVDYHAAPTTIIYGAKASALEKGANKVWSNLPVDAKVENLELTTNLAASQALLEFLKSAVHELSNTPESSLGKLQQISNTSAVALEVTYLPLIEKTIRKQKSYASGILKINTLILKALKIFNKIDWDKQIGSPDKLYETSVAWNSPLPKDVKSELEILDEKLRLKLESHDGALRQVNPQNLETKRVEILADAAQELLLKSEEARALNGLTPNILGLALGSVGLETEISDIFEKSMSLLLKSKKEEMALQPQEVQPEPVTESNKE